MPTMSIVIASTVPSVELCGAALMRLMTFTSASSVDADAAPSSRCMRVSSFMNDCGTVGGALDAPGAVGHDGAPAGAAPAACAPALAPAEVAPDPERDASISCARAARISVGAAALPGPVACAVAPPAPWAFDSLRGLDAF